MAETIKMSQERYDELQKELEYLQSVRVVEVAEHLAQARSYGDLSENSEYDAARDEQSQLYAKMASIKDTLARAEIVQNTVTNGQVGIGSTITILDIEEDEEITYRLVGAGEADINKDKLSEASPLGRALLGHKEGETIQVEAPIGMIAYKIVKIA